MKHPSMEFNNDFSNTLPGYGLTSDDKERPHITSATHETAPTYSASEPETPTVQNVRWTPKRCAHYDYYFHIISLLFGTSTFALYAFDLAKSRSYHVGLPVGIAVVDALAILFLNISNGWSVVYLFSDIHPRMARGELGRKWPTWFDVALHTCLLAISDTTLSMRSGNSNCTQNGPVGACQSYRQAVMIAAGVLMILTA